MVLVFNGFRIVAIMMLLMGYIGDDNTVVFNRNGLPVSYNRNGFGSLCSNLNRAGIDEDDFSPDLPTGMHLS